MAFVQLASEKDVLAALKLHQSELNGRWINVERTGKKSSYTAKKDSSFDRSLSVFVAQLPFSADRDSIRQHFESSGVKGIVDVKMFSEKGTNKRGMAFVQLSTNKGVKAALELDGSEFGSRQIRVEKSSKKDGNDEAAE